MQFPRTSVGVDSSVGKLALGLAICAISLVAADLSLALDPGPDPDPPQQNSPPTIIEFTAVEDPVEAGLWTFTGQVVDDEDPAGLEVWFGGILEEEPSVYTDEIGFFELTVALGTRIGTASAETEDRDGAPSNVATVEL